ncbi:MAG: AAA family ATPase [Ardenticatenaceae bacterium]|nr:AAA family ATPase [Ardenticatenaceae bacterium]
MPKLSPLTPLPPDKLRHICDAAQFEFETTAVLQTHTHIIGQPRGTRAIEFGISIRSQGYNIFVLGATGTGRATAIEHFLRERANGQPTPPDWIYVHNFAVPHQPRAISLPAGEGARFQARMAKLISDIRQDLPQAFEAEAYQNAIAAMQQELEEAQNKLLQTVGEQAEKEGFALVQTPSGFVIAPVTNGRQLSPQEIAQWMAQLTPDQRAALEATHQSLVEKLADVMHQVRQMEMAARRRMKQIDREVAAAAVQHHFDDILASYHEDEEMRLYLTELHQDVLSQIDDFVPPVDSENTEEIDLRRYQVNLFVNNGAAKGGHTMGAPVIRETNPTFHNLFGRIEYELQAGLVTTHFTNIKCGSLHQANGGYLILNASDFYRNPGAWEALKRALKDGKIYAQPPTMLEPGQVMAKSLDPEPIPLNVKIILVGSLPLYYSLYQTDEDFAQLFKVRADFDTEMPRNPETMAEYARFIAGRCQEEGLRHFDRTAVAKVVEHGSRLAEHQHKLSTRFGEVADLVREASYWAGMHGEAASGRTLTTAADVQQALDERIYRASRAEEYAFQEMLDGVIFIATEGSVVGQVNGLSVIDLGDYAFGQPGRITARTYMGDDGITHIERETEMSGPLHEKGVLTLQGYLGGTYAQEQPLSLSASITFEQNYAGVEGDSAASTELFALLSSLSNIPLRQDIGVTGSVNQRGEIQPIGGVNEKIEGFFRLCQKRGLTGSQGVVIPASNGDHLMLHEDVVTAVAEGKFHIWPITTIDQGIELLTGVPAGERNGDGSYPAGTVHHAVQTRLRQLAEELTKFGDSDE